MKFFLEVTVDDCNDKDIVDKCVDVVADYLNSMDFNFDVGYNPETIETSKRS